MKNYKKEDLQKTVQEIAEYLGSTFPGLAFSLVIQTNDRQNFGTCRSMHLQNPYECAKLQAESISLLMNELISMQLNMLKSFQDQQIAIAMSESSTAVKN